MVRRHLTQQATYDVGEAFQGTVVNGDLRLVAPGRTVLLAAFERPSDDPRDGLARMLPPLDAIPSDQQVDEVGPSGELRHAHWYIEPDQSGIRWALYGFTVARTRFVQSAFYFDDFADLDWALEAWRSISIIEA